MSASFLSARRPTVILLAGVALALLLSGTALLPATAATPAPTATTIAPRPARTPRPTPSPTPARISAGIEMDARAGGIAISPRVLGSNLPAWLKKEVFENEVFRERIRASGVRMLRIPGGSWSDEYGWLSCETGKDQPGAFPCRYPWGARPTDFINLLKAVDVEPMYIMNVNSTAQEAAAGVAFYNGLITDARKIGIDRNGTDWKTVGEWAKLRAAGGNPEPLGIRLWEIGNELYGGRVGPAGCPQNGWEETWTCDGVEYIKGTDKHDGLLQMSKAMKAVDPTIKVGAVGHDKPMNSAWAEEVLTAGGDVIDYFAPHVYPTYYDDGSPRRSWAYIMALPQQLWPKLRAEADEAFTTYAQGRRIPIAVNEYNIVPAWGKTDNKNYMNKHVNALFMADSLGQLMLNGFDMAAQWAIMNGKSDDYGNEFGLMKAYEIDPQMTRQPNYFAFPLWSRFGPTMLPVTSTANTETELSVYAGRIDAHTFSLLAINKSDRPADAQITLKGVKQIASGQMDVLVAPSPDAIEVAFNGVVNPKDDLSDAPPQKLSAGQGNAFSHTFAPYSITLLRFNVKP